MPFIGKQVIDKVKLFVYKGTIMNQEISKKLHLVFDIDDCLATAIKYKYKAEDELSHFKESLGNDGDDLLMTAYGYPHQIYPGFYALWQWLHQLGATITVFSSGIKERNVELTEQLKKRAFCDIPIDKQPQIKVFSQEDTFDTTRFGSERREEFQSVWFGNLKKQLLGTVVSESELPYTLLIEDDKSYCAKNEEKNLILLPSCSTYYPYSSRIDQRDFESFHKAYYLCGLLKKILSVCEEKQLTPMMASEYVQVTLENETINRDFYFPSQHNIAYYEDGLKTLQQFEPQLKFFFSLDDCTR